MGYSQNLIRVRTVSFKPCRQLELAMTLFFLQLCLHVMAELLVPVVSKEFYQTLATAPITYIIVEKLVTLVLDTKIPPQWRLTTSSYRIAVITEMFILLVSLQFKKRTVQLNSSLGIKLCYCSAFVMDSKSYSSYSIYHIINIALPLQHLSWTIYHTPVKVYAVRTICCMLLLSFQC